MRLAMRRCFIMWLDKLDEDRLTKKRFFLRLVVYSSLASSYWSANLSYLFCLMHLCCVTEPAARCFLMELACLYFAVSVNKIHYGICPLLLIWLARYSLH